MLKQIRTKFVELFIDEKKKQLCNQFLIEE
jgi:hypothetical protein